MLAWEGGDASPVTVALDRAFIQWRSLRPGDLLVFEWPTPEGTVERCAEPAPSWS